MKKSVIFIFLVVLFFSCKEAEKKTDSLFTLLPSSSTHIYFRNDLTETEQFNMIEYLYFNNGAGVAAGDINNDGLTDLFFTSNQNPNKLYINKGNLQFEDITNAAGVSGQGDWKTGVTMADVNGDGFLDIYVCQLGYYKTIRGKNQLFINQGNLTFKEEAQKYGLDFQGFSTQASFFDYDLDGDLDMYLLNHSVHSSRSYGDVTLRFEHDSLAGSRLYLNDVINGNCNFINVTSNAGIYNSHISYGLGVNVCDINNDGFPDIYISNDFHENDYLYINNRNGTFTERLTEMIEHTSRSSMGNDVGDINNDGLLDVIVLDMLPDEEKIRKQSGGEDDKELFDLKLKLGYNYQFVRNNLQLNLGGNKFAEIGRLSGVWSTDWSWSPLLCDVDNDGFKDLFITNGIYRRANDLDYVKFLTKGNRYFPTNDNSKLSDKELYEQMPLYPNVNYIFKNNCDLSFDNKAPDWGITTRSYSNGSAYADLDNDGDMDLIVNNINEEAYVYRNNSNEQLKNHYLSIDLRGIGKNTRGIGTRVTLYNNGKIQIAEQFPTRGFMSSSSDRLHFGTGTAEIIDSILVRWPDLSEQLIKKVPADTLLTLNISEAAKPLKGDVQKEEMIKLFTQTEITSLNYFHKEDKYNDFKRENLVPHSLSGEGPAMAVGDVNGDGLEDMFIGGAKGQPSAIFVQQKNGTFKTADIQLLSRERFADDVDAAFFDADGDEDQDLYIVRGGNEMATGDLLLTDLLLLNNSNGTFSKGKLPFVSHNGSCVRPCDFDNDGDIDLFIGSRSVPGGYGLAPYQFMLENDGKGHFRDVTDIRMAGLKNIGMVTDAIWTDYDRDGDNDLVIAGEWMKICIIKNEKGNFTDVTNLSGLQETSGWWNCIEAGDIDNDGDIDLIAGNLGLNSTLKASVREPVEMFLNDFDNNGSVDQIICSFEKGISYPVASFDELADQIAGLDKKYPTYASFGGRTVIEIFGKEAIGKSIIQKAELFESCIFLNNGDGAFEIKKLPVWAQFSPVRDILIQDINSDSIPDIVLAGNNYLTRPSLGRLDASYGWFLQGKGKGEFSTIMPVESGLKIEGDARKVLPIRISGKQYIITAVNDGSLQIFRILK